MILYEEVRVSSTKKKDILVEFRKQSSYREADANYSLAGVQYLLPAVERKQQEGRKKLEQKNYATIHDARESIEAVQRQERFFCQVSMLPRRYPEAMQKKWPQS